MFLGVLTHACVVASADDVRATSSLPFVGISEDGQRLEVSRDFDADTQEVAVMRFCGEPVVGEPRISDVMVDNGDIYVTYGKHCFARIRVSTLAVECVGCD